VEGVDLSKKNILVPPILSIKARERWWKRGKKRLSCWNRRQNGWHARRASNFSGGWKTWGGLELENVANAEFIRYILTTGTFIKEEEVG